jgi:hypothetical protein
MYWPWQRFEALFERHLLREAKQTLERQRDLMLAAVNANGNWDGEDNVKAKTDRMEQIELSCQKAIAHLYAKEGEVVRDPAEEAYETDPLFRPARRLRDQVKGQLPNQTGMGYQKLVNG